MILFEEREFIRENPIILPKRNVSVNYTFNFTNCSAIGKNGPASQGVIDAAYAGTSLQGRVTWSAYSQNITLGPGLLKITAKGASGGARTGTALGGRGAKVYSEFTLLSPIVVKVMVGQIGKDSTTGQSYYGGGGGGMSAIWIDGVTSIVAGGGGGVASSGYLNSTIHGSHLTTGNNGSLGTYGVGRAMPLGGDNGNHSSGGAGITNPGDAGTSCTPGLGLAGNYVGGAGYSNIMDGGFGGGGGAYTGGGGGGGAGGGGAGGYSSPNGGSAGGGGSYAIGSNIVIVNGLNHAETGNGYVTIEYEEFVESDSSSLLLPSRLSIRV